MRVSAYGVHIIGLSNKLHSFNFELGKDFFKTYGTDLIAEGLFEAKVDLNKHETFLEATFTIEGTAVLTCDRSLETFEYPVKSRHSIVFKLGDVNEELSDEIVMIHRDTATLELGQYLYEFLALAIPMKKLHPRFLEEEGTDDDTAEGKIVYTSETKADEDEEKEIDPRWNILKKLK